MPVLSVSTTRPNYAMLRNVALKMGVQCEIVEVTEDEVYADLTGTTYKTIQASVRAGASRHAILDSIEHGEKVRSYPARPSA